MKRFLSLALMAGLISGAAIAPAQYAKQGVRFLSQIPLSQFPGQPSTGSACYGFTSPSGREYAIMGLRNGNSIVEITNPASPVQIAHIPGPSSLWHEVVELNGFAYATTEAGGGLQIIDLRQADSGVITLAATYTGGGLDSGHTVQANPASNHVYVNGSNEGFVMLDVSNPTAPVETGRWNTKYVHDCQVVTYTDGPYAGKEIAFLCCGGAGLYIVDITNKANPQTLGIRKYISSGGYCHSGSLTADKRYFLANDEFDEGNGIVDDCTTWVIDVQDLSNPVVATRFLNPITTIDHNSNEKNGFLFLAAYRAGLRVYDVRNPLSIKETGFFDTDPSGNSFSYDSNWGLYSYFPSGNVILSDIDRGLFVVDPTEAAGLGAPIESFEVIAGTGHVAGGAKELRFSDDKVVEEQLIGREMVRVLYRTSYDPRSTVDIELEAWGKGSFFIDLRNWLTGQYERVFSGDFALTKTTHSFTGLQASKYVGADGKIEARMLCGRVSFREQSSAYLDALRVRVNRP